MTSFDFEGSPPVELSGTITPGAIRDNEPVKARRRVSNSTTFQPDLGEQLEQQPQVEAAVRATIGGAIPPAPRDSRIFGGFRLTAVASLNEPALLIPKKVMRRHPVQNVKDRSSRIESLEACIAPAFVKKLAARSSRHRLKSAAAFK